MPAITISRRFNGPAGSGNGGYVCGLMANLIDGPSEATLRAPPPLETPLRLERNGDVVTLHDGGALIGEARPVAFDLAAPPAPTLKEARAAAKRYAGFKHHRYPTCFVCGTGRPEHDGLDLFTGAIEGRDLVACTWMPGGDLADEHGVVRPEFVHAALDCPSYWALPHAGKPALLARLVSNIDGSLPLAGEELIVVAWPLGSAGRKHRGAAALYHGDGALIARAEALWIEPRA